MTRAGKSTSKPLSNITEKSQNEHRSKVQYPTSKKNVEKTDGEEEWIIPKYLNHRNSRWKKKSDQDDLLRKEPVISVPDIENIVDVSKPDEEILHDELSSTKHNVDQEANITSDLKSNSDLEFTRELLLSQETSEQRNDPKSNIEEPRPSLPCQPIPSIDPPKKVKNSKKNKKRRGKSQYSPNVDSGVSNLASVSAVTMIDPMKKAVLDILKEDDKEDYLKVDLGDFNPNNLRSFPIPFIGTINLEDKFDVSEDFEDFTKEFCNRFESLEGQRRVHSFVLQAQRKFSTSKWNQFKDELIAEVVEVANLLKLGEEYPTFEDSTSASWVKTTLKLEALDEEDWNVLWSILPKPCCMERLATLYLMNEFTLNGVKDYYVSEIHKNQLIKENISVPLVLRIESLLYFQESKQDFGVLSETRIANIIHELNIAMYGMMKTGFIPCLGENLNDDRLYALEPYDWLESPVRNYLLKSGKHRELFEQRLKELARAANKSVQTFKMTHYRTTMRQINPKGSSEYQKVFILTVGETLAASHFGLDMEVFSEMKAHIIQMEKYHLKCNKIACTRAPEQQYIFWSSKLPVQFHSHKEKLRDIGMFLSEP